MNRRTKQVGVVLGLVAVLCFVVGWPLYLWLRVKPVSAALFERTKALVERNPQLRPEWDRAMQDGVLTWREAKSIIERAGEKVDPEE
jgi:hypothetical protein